MAFAQGSLSRLCYGVESSSSPYGTAASGTFINLPFTSHSLNLTKDRVAGTDIQPDRMPRHDRHGNKQVSGDIVADLRHADFDPLLESAMLSTFNATTGIIKVGTQDKTFTMEDFNSDVDEARLFTGLRVSSLGVSIAPNQMVTATYSMIGRDMSISNTEKTSTTDISGNSPFDSYSGNIKLGNWAASGATSLVASSIVTGLDFTLTNSFAPTFVVGNDLAPELEVGRAEVEGTLSVYFEDETQINRFINETETAIEVQVGDGTETMTFLFPRSKINSADVSVDGPTSRIITMGFVSLFDTEEETNLKITRS